MTLKEHLTELDKTIEVQIVDFMTEYITQHDVPSLIELVLKAIQKVEKEGEEKDAKEDCN